MPHTEPLLNSDVQLSEKEGEEEGGDLSSDEGHEEEGREEGGQSGQKEAQEEEAQEEGGLSESSSGLDYSTAIEDELIAASLQLQALSMRYNYK